MTYNGAGGKTKQEMADVLNVKTLKRSELNRLFKDSIAQLPDTGSDVRLHSAQSLWMQEGRNLHEGFVERVNEHYRAEVNTLDFRDDRAADVINGDVRASGGKN